MAKKKDKKATGYSNENKELNAIAAAFIFLVLGFAVIWVTKSFLNIEKDAVFISLLLIPVLIYTIVSGRLKELKGPGGLEAKFAESAAESISSQSETIEASIDEMQIVEKEGARTLEKKREELNEAVPIVMTVVLGRHDYYRRLALLHYIEMLYQFRNFKFIVFVDKNSRFVAYMPSWSLKGLLKMDELGDELVNIINEGRADKLFLYPGVIKETISNKSSNAEALREMTKQNLEALVVIDENRHLKGVVEREQILSKMMLALTK